MKSLSKSNIALLIPVAGFILLALNVAPVPHAGVPANILAQKLGVDPFPLFQSPVYGWVVGAIGAVTGGAAVYAVNLFSALCASLLLGLLFALAYRLTPVFNFENAVSRVVMHRIQTFAGVIAVLYLLASTPFWLAATRAGPLTFNLLLLAYCFYLVVSYTEKSGSARMFLAALLYGITMVEFTTAIILGPLFALLVLMRLYNTGTMRPHVVIKLAGCGLVGVSLYLVQAGLFRASPVYVWREFKDIFQVIWYIWLEQYQRLGGGLPRVGWLTILLVSALPWVITSTLSVTKKSSFMQGARFGRNALNLMLAALAVLLLTDNFPLAPVTLTGTRVIFLTPYVIIAMWAGNVVAYWGVACFRARRFERPWQLRARRSAGYALAAAFPAYLVFMLATAAVPATKSTHDLLIQRATEAIVDAVADKEWLITNTMLDDQIGLEIRKRGLSIKVIPLSYSRSVPMMRYVASLFEDYPRLQSLAAIGMEPLIDEWLTSMPEISKKVGMINAPDFWLVAGLQAIPDQLVFRGAPADEVIDVDALYASARAFWDGLGREIETTESDLSASGLQVKWLKVHASKVANNLGVMLEDNGRADLAYPCYEQARRFEPENLSALMNMHVLAQREKRPEFEALEKELMERVEAIMGRVQANALAHAYGYVRVPESFVNRGMTFAMSGKAAMAISEIKRALALREGSPQLQLALANLYFGQQQDIQSKEYYTRVLEENPGNVQALLGLMRLASRQQDFTEARRLLQLIKDAGAPASSVKTEEAFIEAISGSPALAMQMLQDVVAANNKNITAWAALAAIASELKDQKVTESALKALQDARVDAPVIKLIMAQAALNQNDRDAARRHLQDLLRRQPGHVAALEMLLRIELSEGNRDDVQNAVERILRVDPENALANYMLGVYHYYREEYLLAESAYRASLAKRRSPEALNDLAYVLHLLDRSEEAIALVQESLALNNQNPAAWDTLGTVLMAQGKLSEAEAALRQSLTIRPDAASVMLSLALLHEKQERYDDADRLARQVNSRLNELSPESQASIRELIRRLDNRK